MNKSEIIKNIRNRLNFSQNQLAETMGVSFATVNRWENGHCEPSQIAVNTLKRLCEDNNIDYSQYEGNSIFIGKDKLRLYHGSKSGIEGIIMPNSREHCDFGKGFYMGTEKMQPLTLICNFPNAKIYKIELNLEGLKILDIEVGIDWALFVAYNRGAMNHIKDTAIYNKYANIANDCDIVAGYIANDRMFVVLERFFSGDITDVALINSLSVLKLGKQYVAVTDKACGQISIVSENTITNEERRELIKSGESNRQEGVAKANDICRRYRREGKYFDEILKEGM